MFNNVALAAELGRRLAGKPEGSGNSFSTGRFPGAVVWVHAGSEVAVYLDSVKTQLADGLLLVSVDFECDQTGRTPLVAALAMNKGTDSAGLFATTDELPRGNGLLAARWGKIFQEALWAALTSLISDHAAERRLSPLALTIIKDQLELHSGSPITVTRSSVLAPSSLTPSRPTRLKI